MTLGRSWSWANRWSRAWLALMHGNKCNSCRIIFYEEWERRLEYASEVA